MRSAVILAGGKSSRFGRDKGLARLGGKPLVRRVADGLRPVVDETIISISSRNGQQAYRSRPPPHARFVEDRFADIGPLGGLITAFEEAGGEYVAVAPCDAPFIKPALYGMLFELAQGTDGAVPVVGGYFEPLNAVYRRQGMLPAMKRALAEGLTKPVDAYRHLDILAVGERSLRRADPGLESFVNLNTPEALGRARGRMRRGERRRALEELSGRRGVNRGSRARGSRPS